MIKMTVHCELFHLIASLLPPKDDYSWNPEKCCPQNDSCNKNNQICRAAGHVVKYHNYVS